MSRLVLAVTATLILLFVSVHTASAAPVEFIITDTVPAEFYPSETITFNITIKNIGVGQAIFATAELLPGADTQIQIVGVSKKNIGSIMAGQARTIEYKVFVDETAATGIYDVPLMVQWKTSLDIVNNQQETLHLGLQIVGLRNLANLRVMKVITKPDIITPGEAFGMSVSFKNVGGEPAELIKVKLLTNPPLSIIESDAETYIPSLEPNETAGTDFRIAIDNSAESKLYDVSLSVEYLSRNIRFVKNNTFGIVTRGIPNIYIQEIILQPSKLVQNKDGLLIIKLINTGTESAEDVKVRIMGGKGLLTESFNFIGEVKRDDIETTSFGVYIDPSEEIGIHGLNIDITYKDKFGNSYTESKIYEVSVYPKSSLTSYIIAAVVLITFSAAMYLYVIFYRTKLEKREGK